MTTQITVTVDRKAMTYTITSDAQAGVIAAGSAVKLTLRAVDGALARVELASSVGVPFDDMIATEDPGTWTKLVTGQLEPFALSVPDYAGTAAVFTPRFTLDVNQEAIIEAGRGAQVDVLGPRQATLGITRAGAPTALFVGQGYDVTLPADGAQVYTIADADLGLYELAVLDPKRAPLKGKINVSVTVRAGGTGDAPR